MVKVDFDSRANGISCNIHRAFGYVVFEYTLAKGATIQMDSSGGARAESENRTLCTRGILEIANSDNTDKRYRYAGDYSQELSDLRAGTFNQTAIEEFSWWCINSKTNNGKLPNLAPFKLSAGSSAELDLGTKLLICSGTLSIKDLSKSKGSTIAIVSSDKIAATANDQVYGLQFL